MREGEREKSVKLFVGQVPKQMTESELLSLFSEVSVVDQVHVIRDKTTSASRGCCFVICPSKEEADKAVGAFHNQKILLGASGPLQVKYADGELERLEHKIFVGMLPKNVDYSDVSQLFSKYGNIRDLQILRGSQETNKGCAFLKYETKEQALAAIEDLNAKHKMEGSNIPLVVKWADTEQERQARRDQKLHSHASIFPYANNAQIGSLAMGYVPPYNAYGYQPTGTYGLLQYQLPPMQNQHAFPSIIRPVNQDNMLRGVGPNASPSISPRNYALQPANFVGSAYSPMSGFQYRLSYPGARMGNRPFSNFTSTLPSPVNVKNHSAASSSANGTSGGQVEGPPGANLFIYHIPQEFDDQELANTFQSFGRVLSAKVFVDKVTGVSKCFGFVSYESPAAAQSAISRMDGHQLNGKKLKVQLKRERIR